MASVGAKQRWVREGWSNAWLGTRPITARLTLPVRASDRLFSATDGAKLSWLFHTPFKFLSEKNLERLDILVELMLCASIGNMKYETRADPSPRSKSSGNRCPETATGFAAQQRK